MQFQPDELQEIENLFWIMGTKLKEDLYFHVQIIEGYKRYSSLFATCLNDKNIDFYFMPINLPVKLKPETAPF